MLIKLLRATAITTLLVFLAQDGLLPIARSPQPKDFQPLQQANLHRRLP